MEGNFTTKALQQAVAQARHFISIAQYMETWGQKYVDAKGIERYYRNASATEMQLAAIDLEYAAYRVSHGREKPLPAIPKKLRG